MDVPNAVARVDVPFAGEGAGDAELTWGQRAMYQAMLRERSWLPMGGHRPVPGGTTVADVEAELRYTMERYQAFRTRLRPRDGGPPGQSVAAAGVAHLDVVEADGADPDDVAAAVERAYRGTEPDLARDWPMRMAVVCRGGRPARLVAIMPHLVTDGIGAAVMVDEVTRRVAAPVAGLRPLDLVEWQASPAGARQHAGALRHWERHAPGLEPFTTGIRSSQRYRKCLLESPRLAARLPEAAGRTGVDQSTVLLAAYLAAIGRVAGRGTVAVRQVVSNRFRSGLSDVVSPITQLGLCVADVSGGFGEAVANVARAALPARKYAYYDPFAMPDAPTPCFNDRRATAATAFRSAGSGAERTDPGTLTWTAPPPGPTEPLFLHADDVPGAVRLTLDVDTACFSPADVEAIARTIEELV
ncbi:condensation domain-containing protein [Dactylosporangium sp. NPDC048998]|uniref:condensation domain-containing protein n=1 Tax=Dactylosporangium sp. NPDC048998 TaxID=3363976 RepID=UPI003718B8D5